ncbi:MAG: GntG family PLP-dependent aldolase [Bacteroidota bacterium]
MIDLRSDTVTKPTPEMLNAMMAAKVGDDVFIEDPSINALEEKVAAIFGMEAGLFCPSGTMTNQIAIKVHTQPGDEVICDKLSHIYQYEAGGIAFNSGCSVNLITGDKGRISALQVLDAINADDIHKAISRLVSLENTSNRGGGTCYDWKEINAIRDVCNLHGLQLHLDGARIFNAIVAKKEDPKQYGNTFDSISVCLSKGLGTPVGSVLIGNKSFIHKARRVRKLFGGGMRQAGYLAAAGTYALDNHIERLEEDHKNAKLVADALHNKPWVKEVIAPETNILIFETTPPFTSLQIVNKLKEFNVLCYPIAPQQVRMVFHLDINKEMIIELINIVHNLEVQ